MLLISTCGPIRRRRNGDSESREQVQGLNLAVKPVPGMVVLFPPWLGHEVGAQTRLFLSSP